MKKFLMSALGALLLSSCSVSETPSHSALQSVQVGSSHGLVRPTDYTGCVVVTPQQQKALEKPLPKSVPNATWYNTGSPPVRYQNDVSATIHFQHPNIINRNGQGGTIGCRGAVFAYAYKNTRTIHLPNPCTYPETDAYARLACHEMAHINGWPGYHGD